jgi:hypothetical protein
MRILPSSVRKGLSRAAAHLLIGAQAVAFAGSAAGVPVTPGAGDQPSAKHLVMLYRKETDSSPNRLDPTVQATTLALQHEFLNRQYQITEPSAEAYRAMDQGPGVIVTFAPDAGMSMVYSVYASMRPEPGTDIAIAEVRIEARVFVGSTLLSAEQARGQIQTRTDPALQKYGEARGYEIAAQRAAVDLANRVNTRLSALGADEIVNLMAADKTEATSFVLVTPPDASPSASPGSAAPTQPPASPSAPDSSAAGPSTPAKRWLLTVGVSDYSKATGFAGAGTHDNDLPGTPTDVKNVQRTLKGFGFDDATTIQLFDRSATTGAVRAALERLTASAGANDVAVLYISTHGMERNYGKAGMTMPVFYDTNVGADPNNLLDFAELVKLFSRIPAKQLIMFIDACHSGGAAKQMTTVAISMRSVDVVHSGGSPDIARVLTAAKGIRGDIAVMSAARTDETALDLGPSVGGLFTSKLMSALATTRGATPLEEMYKNYVWSPVIEYCRKNPAGEPPCQHPVLGYGGSGNMIRFGAAAP